MPTTVTASNGNVYHLWQLPDNPDSGGPPGSAPEPESSIEFTTLDNNLADGYRSTRLFGSNTGVREWKLKLPTLAGSTVPVPFVTDINGASVSREEYVWSLYVENKITGTPFAYTDPRSGQYYLVDFMDEQLTYSRMRVKLYSTGLTLRQRRLQGVTIFSVSSISPALAVLGQYIGDTAFVSGEWPDSINSIDLELAGDVVHADSVINGHAVKRFNNTANTGYCFSALNPVSWKEFFLVMKMREATFSNAAGIITDKLAGNVQMLLGSSGTTKFANPGLSATAFTYRKNGTEYTQSDMQAPMNEFGIVHIRYTIGWNTDEAIQFGRDRETAGTYAEMDVAEIIASDAALPTNIGREITEYLTVKYAIA